MGFHRSIIRAVFLVLIWTVRIVLLIINTVIVIYTIPFIVIFFPTVDIWELFEWPLKIKKQT